MRCRPTGIVATGLVAFVLFILASTASADGTRAQDPDGLLDAKALAGRIDYWLGVRQAATGVKAAGPSPTTPSSFADCTSTCPAAFHPSSMPATSLMTAAPTSV